MLYYYRYDNLEGGEIEFIDKLPIKEDFWIHGDCDPDVFSKEDIRSYIDQVPRCKVPIKEGNMVIFSNY